MEQGDKRGVCPIRLESCPSIAYNIWRRKECEMSTKTRMVTINAAFLHEIKEDNRELRRLLKSAATMFREKDRTRIDYKELVKVLGELRDRFALHFSLEEAYGYFEDALDVPPRLSERASSLRDEHRELYMSISQLEDEAERQLYHEKDSVAFSKMCDEFFEFYQAFRSHEERETEVILDSLGDEIGGGD